MQTQGKHGLRKHDSKLRTAAVALRGYAKHAVDKGDNAGQPTHPGSACTSAQRNPGSLLNSNEFLRHGKMASGFDRVDFKVSHARQRVQFVEHGDAVPVRGADAPHVERLRNVIDGEHPDEHDG